MPPYRARLPPARAQQMVVHRTDHVSDRFEPPRGRFWQTQVLTNSARLGYGANLNLILEASTARYVLLMNTDMYFDPAEPCLAKMVQFMDAQPDCGVSICRLYRPDGSYGYPARRFQTLGAIAGRRLGLGSLFAGSVGRTDLPGGDAPTLIDCIKRNLLTLAGETVVYPGHGPTTSIEHEARTNPFLRF